MQNFITALKAEHIKKKGTGIYIFSIILSAFTPIITTVIQLVSDMRQPNNLPHNHYLDFIKLGLNAFADFFLPLIIIITASRIAQLDHKNGGWQLMETQPVRKISIYFSKFTVLLITNIIAIGTFIIMSYLCGWILSLATDIPKSASTEILVSDTLLIMARLFVAGLFFSVLQYVISVLIPSFIWSIVIGFFILLLLGILKINNLVPDWYPVEMLSKVSKYPDGSELGYGFTYSEAASILCAVIVAYIGFEWYRHKTFKYAFFGKAARAVKLLVVLTVFGGLLAYTLIPNKMPEHDKTVISGTIDSDMKFSYIFITDNFIGDTVAVIPISNNKFRHEITQNVVLDDYKITFDRSINSPLIFGNNDSIYLDVTFYKNNGKIKATGTRLAENQYQKEGGMWSMVSYYLEENQLVDAPAVFTGYLVSDWKDAMAESIKFKTADNYIPKDDFQAKNKKLITLEFLDYWNQYLKKRAAMFPNEETEESADIKAMKKLVSLNDESLLSDENYFNYVKSQLILKNKEDIDENTKSLLAIAKMPAGTFKDKMLLWQLNKSIKEASGKEERDRLLARYAYTFKNKKYTALVENNARILENLSKGKPAPLFDAVTLDNKPFNLAQLKGQHVVIDVWATWCAPCRFQSPYFEKLALKYKDEPVKFIAVSSDQKIDDWFIDAKAKSKSVLQLHLNDIEKFGEEYNVESIPRFILIAPDGSLVNARMPYPEDKMFEKVLREALGLSEEK